ncbi:site-specific integrase [Ornithobacterium rhinotracheale]|uniref:site-specific integrase n=1 Tax=Ornithobacterium rhinotracheale TaxID=28251 RepID=UPI0023EAFF6D|nr:site-specific integrase [Ornithobacterium rhinotracheale]
MDKKNYFIAQVTSKQYREVSIKQNFNLKNYVNKRGESQVMLTLHAEGIRRRILLDVFVDPAKWDKKHQRVKGKAATASTINTLLDSYLQKILDIKLRYSLTNSVLTLEKLVEEFNNQKSPFDFVYFCTLHINEKNMSLGSKKKELSHINKLKLYDDGVLVSNITEAYIDKYKRYLSNELGNKKSTINSNMKTIKKYLLLAKRYGMPLNIEAEKIKTPNLRSDRVNLEESEIKKLKDYYFSSFIKPKHKLPLGYFLFACYTGCRLSELKQIRREDIEGKKILTYFAPKTQKRQSIQISSSARDIFEHEPTLFARFISDQKMNKYIKECAQICNIKKNVTMHVARHSFATNLIRKGAKITNVQSLLNHSDISTTMQYYHGIASEEISDIHLLD